MICDYLRQHHNFYDCLENILIEEIGFKALPQYFQSEKKAKFIKQLEQHQKHLTIFLDDIEKLKKEFDNVPYFKTYVEQLHKNLHLLK